jgi:adenylosuccinate synthase
MPATIVLGGQWGDEGKGKLTDALASQARMVVRANGGSNAGHTIATEAGLFKLHLVPSGILNPNCICVIGAGVVIDLEVLIGELDELTERGVDVNGLRISDRAHLVLPYHPQLDRLEEKERSGDQIGTTLRGNGPAYADKVARRGIRVADLFDKVGFQRALTREVSAKNRVMDLYQLPELDPTPLIQQFTAYGERIREHVVSAEAIVQDALFEGQEVLVECAQGAMLDLDYGTYPYVTSSSPTAAGACQGAGVAPSQVRRVVAVFKAYSTRVGGGPLPTELTDDTGSLIRERGREYGTTTGRPRRIGWFDGAAARHVARLNGVTDVALTLLDVLDTLPRVWIGTAYTLDGEPVTTLPALADRLEQVKPIYTEVPGWVTPITAARSISDLPTNARAYLDFLATQIGSPITMVGVGPGRDALIHVRA